MSGDHEHRPGWWVSFRGGLWVAGVMALLAWGGCPSGSGGDDDTTDPPAGDDDDTSEPFAVSGEVRVVPVVYEQDGEGEWVRSELDWFEVAEDGYSLGRLYTALVADPEDLGNPLAIDVSGGLSADPASEPMTFALEPPSPLDGIEQVRVVAVADSWHDLVISERDGMGLSEQPVLPADGAATGLQITVDVEFIWCDPWTVGKHGEPCSADCAGFIEVAGTVQLHGAGLPDAAGPAMVALCGEDGEGPWWVVEAGELDAQEPDMPRPWEVTTCTSWTTRILAAWDSNGNGLFEPTDAWGSPVDGLDGDPCEVWELGDEPVADVLVSIPTAVDVPL